jgi:hypothetical protein
VELAVEELIMADLAEELVVIEQFAQKLFVLK